MAPINLVFLPSHLTTYFIDDHDLLKKSLSLRKCDRDGRTNFFMLVQNLLFYRFIKPAAAAILFVLKLILIIIYVHLMVLIIKQTKTI